MIQIYDVIKSFFDPIFIIFILLLIACIVWVLSSKKKSDTLLLFFAIVLLYGASIYPVSNYFAYQLEKDYINTSPKDKTKFDVIVVLSGGAYNINALNKTFLGEKTVVRLMYAVQMYKKHDAKYLVCSGKSDAKIPDAQLMAQMAEQFGASKDKILIEPKSKNTYNHALEFNKLFADKNIKIGLVTSASHMKRSEKQFRKYFSNVLPLPADYLYTAPAGTSAVKYIPQSHWLYNNTVILREYVGRLWYSMKDSL